MANMDPENITLQDALKATSDLYLRRLPQHIQVGPMPRGIVSPLVLPLRDLNPSAQQMKHCFDLIYDYTGNISTDALAPILRDQAWSELPVPFGLKNELGVKYDLLQIFIIPQENGKHCLVKHIFLPDAKVKASLFHEVVYGTVSKKGSHAPPERSEEELDKGFAFIREHGVRDNGNLKHLATDATMSQLIARYDLVISDFEDEVQETRYWGGEGQYRSASDFDYFSGCDVSQVDGMAILKRSVFLIFARNIIYWPFVSTTIPPQHPLSRYLTPIELDSPSPPAKKAHVDELSEPLHVQTMNPDFAGFQSAADEDEDVSDPIPSFGSRPDMFLSQELEQIIDETFPDEMDIASPGPEEFLNMGTRLKPWTYCSVKKIFAYRCTRKSCMKRTQPPDFHPIFLQGRGNSKTSLQLQTAILYCAVIGLSAVQTHFLLDVDHKPVERIFTNLDIAKARYVVHKEKSIQYGGWKDVEADEVDLGKGIFPNPRSPLIMPGRNSGVA
ncbi:unnamed protein product [Symbiodinium necroappetens]|uniref:Uncharacterized protein n=1 Tax=Symbiodinium necroappetens TaxID=1628268 RepID=A0A812XSS3_9DINO|nr:unnamed protein product [Symbiodinium necroappetens]